MAYCTARNARVIATNILVVKCDGCGHMDIFTVEHKLEVGAVMPSTADIEREGWTAVDKWDNDTNGYRVFHYCKDHGGKAKA
jgi:hypothetical protein